MVRGRRVTAVFAAALAVAIVLGSPGLASAAFIYLDPGHGGIYNHARRYGLVEKTVNLQISLALRTQLRARGNTVGMTRTWDTAVETRDIPTWNYSSSSGWHFRPDGKRYGDPPKDDLQGRVNKANAAGADIFISVHNNGGPTSARGTETYADGDDALGRALAKQVQSAVVQQVGTRNRGSFDMGFYVVRWANMPAILVECGFITNPYDAVKLASPWYRARFAIGIANGVSRFLASKPFGARYPRLAGNDVYAQASKLSSTGWPNGAQTVLLASGDTAEWTDAVVAAPLSRKLDAPILLANAGGVPAATAAELKRLAPSHLVILGTGAAIPSQVASVAASVASLPPEAVSRVGGVDRYSTAAAIAREVGLGGATPITLVSATSGMDALSASTFAARWLSPIVLSTGKSLPSATRSYLQESADVAHTLVKIGVAQAVPSSETTGFGAIMRVYGLDSYRTNIAVLNWYYKGKTSPLVPWCNANSTSVTLGAFAAKTGRPIVFVGNRRLSPYTREWVLRNASRIDPPTIVGPTSQVPGVMEWEWLKSRDGR